MKVGDDWALLVASGINVRPIGIDRLTSRCNQYGDFYGMDVKLLDTLARDYLLKTLPPKIRAEVYDAIKSGKGTLKRGSLDKIESDDKNFAALKYLVNTPEVTEAATADKGENGTEFFYESETSYYRGQTYTPNGEDGVVKSPSGNLRAVAPDRTGKGGSISEEDAVVVFAHELYGHAYLFRQKPRNTTWGRHGKWMEELEERTRRNYREGEKKKKPKKSKPQK